MCIFNLANQFWVAKQANIRFDKLEIDLLVFSFGKEPKLDE